MNIRILKKDLKRKKTNNLILLLFIFLSATFIASSLNNFSVIQNGVDEFIEQSELADFLILTMGGSFDELSENDQNIESFLKDHAQVKSFTMNDQLYLTSNQTELRSGKHLEMASTMVLSSLQMQGQKFFTENNQELTKIEEGKMYLGRQTMLENNLEAGDKLTIFTENGFRKTFTIAGSFKDAFLGSEMMGSERLLVSEADYQKLQQESGLPYGRTYSISCNDLEKFQESYHNQGFHVLFAADQSLIKMTYIMEMVVAAVILGVSICLIAIALVMLKFTIVFTVNEDYKEIGIMKAIGIKDCAVRRLYTTKYFVLAAVGSLLGFATSIPFGKILIAQVTEKLVIKEDGTGLCFQFAVSMAIMVLVTLSGYHSTRRMKKMTPMDAIRRGNNGERFHRKGLFRLQGSHISATTFLACNDVVSELRKYLVLAVTGMLGVWLIAMPVNTINTLRSDGLLEWFGTQKCDFFIVDEEKISELILSGEKQKFYDYLEDTKQLLREHEILANKVYTEVFFRLKIRKGDQSYQSLSLQGLNTRMEDYVYDEGVAPVYENEIAVTHIVAEKIGASVGDTIYITNGDKEEPYVITAMYQSMNNMGEGIRFTEQAKLDYTATAGGFGIQVRLGDQDQDFEQIRDSIKKIMPQVKVQSVQEFIDHMVGGVSEQLDALKIMILVIVICINILVVVLMQKMFLIREQGEMGILKAIGFSNQSIIAWQTKRIMLVLFFGIAAGTLTGSGFSKITAGKVFQMVGASEITFVINPLEVYLIYPLAVFIVTVFACMVTMQKVRKISVQQINEMD